MRVSSMNISIARASLIVAIGCLLLSSYSIYSAISLHSVTDRYYFTVIVCWITGIFFFVLSAANVCIAFAFEFGIVDSVEGSTNSATLIRAGNVAEENIKVQWTHQLGSIENDGNFECKYVLFISKWRPWVCLRDTFLP